MTQLCVVSICKNEENNIAAWLDHVKHADKICIVDTGSDDGTQDLLMKYSESMPNLSILYDINSDRDLASARNLATSECGSDDLLVWLDFDERFSDNDWVRVLKETYLPEVADGLAGLYITMHNGESVYPQLKAYVKSKYTWKYRAHEVLIAAAQSGTYVAPVQAFHTNHYPDHSKPRNYTMELAKDLRDNPRDTRVMFYYARELFYNVIFDRVPNQRILDHYKEGQLLMERMMQCECWVDYRCLLAQDYMRAAYMVEDLEGSLQAGYIGLAARPDRVESYGTFADLVQMCGDNVTALSLAIQGLSKSKSHNLLFDSWIPNMDLCYDVAIKSCTELGMDDKSLYYAAAKKQFVSDTSKEE